MANEWTLDEIGRVINRHDRELNDFRNEVHGQYLRKDVYAAERDADRSRIQRLEVDDTSKASGNRAWLLGLVQMVLGVVLGAVAAVLTARGGH